MSKSEKPSRLSPRAKDILWHGGKSLLCAAQFLAASTVARESVTTMMSGSLEDPVYHVHYWLILLTAQLILFCMLWHYYDENDDRSFDRFCEPDEPPRLLRDPAYIVGLLLTAAGGGGSFVISLQPILHRLLPRLPAALTVLLCAVMGMLVAGGLSVLRLRRRNEVWRVQKNLRRPTDKRLSVTKRVVYAVIFFVAVLLLSVLLTSLVPYLIYFFVSMLLISTGILIAVICAVLALMAFLALRRITDRRKFFGRLERLRDRGELSFTIHGSPYLSLFIRRLEFGLTITDEPHPDSRVKTPTTYQVAVANCNRRRMTVVLCENNIFQFMHSFKLRVVGNARTLTLGANRFLDIPLGAFFTSHDFEFPAGEGKRILLVDPAPVNLCMRGFKEGQLIALDNASELFGYTVYGKNAFVSLLERS